MQFTNLKAIVVKAIPFKENQKIVTLFSENLGIVSMILKGISSKNSHNLPFTQSFCEADFLVSKKNSELLIFQEGAILDLHLSLRNNLSSLQTAFSLINTIFRSQIPGKSSPELYMLLSSFLKQIPLFNNHETLLGCFYLKMMKYEGVYSPQEHDLETNTPFFSQNEKNILSTICNIQSFQKLKETPFSKDLLLKIENLFSMRI